MSQTDQSQPDPFRAIADANRRRVLDLLHERPRSVGELVEHLGVSQPAVSQQLNVLRAAGLVNSERVGRRQVYSVAGDRLAEVMGWLTKYEAFWDDRLEGLGRHLAKKLN